MNVERPELRLVREKLESVLAPELAASILFEALTESGGRPPSTGEATLALVEGPLARVLGRRVRTTERDVIVSDLVELLRAIVGPALTPAQPIHVAKYRREHEPTLEVTRDRGAVSVLVLAGKEDLATRLEATLGPGRVSARTLTTRAELSALLGRDSRFPAIVLVDAVEFPAIEPVELADLLERTPAGTVHAIWGGDLPYGSMILGELVERRVPATPLDRREGIEPLLDLVRSRRA